MTDILAEQVRLLRTKHPLYCCRPNSRFTHICMRALGHKGKCSWETKDGRRYSPTLDTMWEQLQLELGHA